MSKKRDNRKLKLNNNFVKKVNGKEGDFSKDEINENFLNKLEIYGYEHYVTYFIYSIITGMPILLIGPHGTGKTYLTEKIADFLGLKFHTYDASKAMFEDIVGFPNPDDMKNGKISYIKGELTLWDKEFILIDELSRALPSSQNKWLEVIRSRKLMGVKLDKLKYIFAAMNPPSYAGAMPLDEALADRFSFIINIDDSVGNNIENIIKVETVEDSPLIEKNSKELVANGFNEFVNSKRIEFYKNIHEDKLFSRFITVFSKMWEVNLAKLYISPRRWKMIYHNLIGVATIYNQTTDLKKDMLLNVILHSLPYAATDDELIPDRQIIGNMIGDSIELLKKNKSIEEIKEIIDGSSQTLKLEQHSKNELRIDNESDVDNAIKFLINLGEDWDSIVENKDFGFYMIFNSIISSIDTNSDYIHKIEYFEDVPIEELSILLIMDKVLKKYEYEEFFIDELFEKVDEIYQGRI